MWKLLNFDKGVDDPKENVIQLNTKGVKKTIGKCYSTRGWEQDHAKYT